MYRIGCDRPVTVAFQTLGNTELLGIGLLQMTQRSRSILASYSCGGREIDEHQ